ncbi:hypothetical protein BGZ96_008169 [Linnemannia gamsii]|uniref:Uncharacterized protein n=1 Tax=Linnemannia gamsii TaxID=64522 RepID=A0ABQ7JZY4_9FUNG|nr:hypothetical protein BGZ96_008169 [Linnemannia gamsii]
MNARRHESIAYHPLSKVGYLMTDEVVDFSDTPERVALADMDEVERGHGRGSSGEEEDGSHTKSGAAAVDVPGQKQEQGQDRDQQQYQGDD